MQGVVSHGTQPCKRDALPAELTARGAENRAFLGLSRTTDQRSNGTERKREGLRVLQSPEIVPNRCGTFTVEEMADAMAALDWPADPRPWNFPKAPEGHIVYFVGGETGPVKIGFTQQAMKARLVCIQNGSPVKLYVLATVRAHRNLERLYHRQFSAHRLHGEWFERSPEIQAEIDRLKAMRPNPTAVDHKGES